ncbi:hypothetical protein AVEN_177460-1 [Araneus ventricosus]|uniref:Uncharacterized protein n=1 Tax=Araneus ventricosus TaxID=182803 RepID=A0A4Y2Q215_ARAVE|nr:hypothetical protein AVEN_177460-1 [Araneus ventricosus]
MSRTTPKLAPISSNFRTTPARPGRSAVTHIFKWVTVVHHTSRKTYDSLRVIQRATAPHTRQIFVGFGSQTWNPPKPRPYQ